MCSPAASRTSKSGLKYECIRACKTSYEEPYTDPLRSSPSLHPLIPGGSHWGVRKRVGFFSRARKENRLRSRTRVPIAGPTASGCGFLRPARLGSARLRETTRVHPPRGEGKGRGPCCTGVGACGRARLVLRCRPISCPPISKFIPRRAWVLLD